MQVIVTRPALQALDWVHRLEAHGIEARALPLIGIAPADSPDERAALAAAWQALGSLRLVVFVSPNAVTQFFAHRPGDGQQRSPTGASTGASTDARWPATLLAASPGPGTTRSLIECGVPAEQVIEPAADSPQFDSEALWARLERLDWDGAGVLVVRGDGGRDWLAETLCRHGARVDRVSAYRRCLPRLHADQNALLGTAINAPAGYIWFFSSSEAIDNLSTLAGPAAEAAWRASTAIATHPRIAARAAACGFARVVAAQPSVRDVVACIQSLRAE